jgi:hypothetical protein
MPQESDINVPRPPACAVRRGGWTPVMERVILLSIGTCSADPEFPQLQVLENRKGML